MLRIGFYVPYSFVAELAADTLAAAHELTADTLNLPMLVERDCSGLFKKKHNSSINIHSKVMAFDST